MSGWRTLSTIIREAGLARIDLLKVDAERSEIAILRGIEDGDWAKIRQMVLEVHDQAELEVAVNMLKARGFQVAVEQESQFADSGVFNCFAIRA